jgi:hypothetical protein
MLPQDLVAKMADYEEGKMPFHEIVKFFQFLIDCGLMSGFQGYYGLTAQELIAAGYCRPLSKPFSRN